jgi:tripartite-type tricarboxylate transporter receptor subunit TctC
MKQSCLAALLLAGLGWLQPAGAQDDAARFPSKPVRWVVPYPPGASNDVVARVLSAKVSGRWGHQMLIDNRGGAGGMLGGDMVAKAAPDGYTLLMANPGSNSINFALRMKSPYRAEDFAEVILLGWSPITVVVGPSFKGASVRELVAQARANPGKFTGGSSGNGGSSHLALELFKMVTGTDILHVPYKGAAPAMADLVADQISMVFVTSLSAEALIKAGKLRMIGVSGNKRLANMPEVPTTQEQGVQNFDVPIWFGVSAPARTPRPIINKINAELNAVIALPDVRERFAMLGLDPQGGPPERFAAVVKEDIERLEKVVKAANVSAE